MSETMTKKMKLIKKFLFPFFLAAGVVCFLYAIVMFVSGFGGYLSFVWMIPAVLSVLFAFMARGKVTLKRWQKRMMWIVLLPIVCFFLTVELIIGSAFFEKPDEEPEYIVVLGTTVYESGPCYLLRQRLLETAKWADVYKDAKIVVTGGRGKTEPFTEGGEMKRYLVEELGIEKERILVEEASVNTYENMTFAGEILKKEDPNFSYEKTPVLVVTNNFHMYRALKIAQKAGYENLSGAPSGTYPLLFPHYMVREFCAILKNMVLGRM